MRYALCLSRSQAEQIQPRKVEAAYIAYSN